MLCFCRHGIKFVSTIDQVLEASKDFSGFIIVREGNFVVRVVDSKIPDNFVPLVVNYKRVKLSNVTFTPGELLLVPSIYQLPSLPITFNGYLFVLDENLLVRVTNGAYPDSFLDFVKQKVSQNKAKQPRLDALKIDVLGDNSCIGFYPLDGSPADVANKNDGRWYGVESYTLGKFGFAAEFSSYKPNFIEISAQFELPLSVSLWFYPYELNDKSLPLLTFETTGKKVSLKIGENSSRTVLEIEPSMTKVSADIRLNDWNHLAVSLARSKVVQLYVNGEYFEVPIGFEVQAIQSILLGAKRVYTSYGTIIQTFSGRIDQVRLFGKVLSQNDINKILQAEG